MKKILTFSFIGIILFAEKAIAQNIIIQQNNQTQNQPQVIEKKVYVENPVYIEKSNPKPTSPVCIMGYLYVFPETFYGYVKDVESVIRELNNNNAHGFRNWRLPTIAELQVIYSNRKSLPGIMNGDVGYLSSEYAGMSDGFERRRIFDPQGTHWSIEYGTCIAGTAILVRK